MQQRAGDAETLTRAVAEILNAVPRMLMQREFGEERIRLVRRMAARHLKQLRDEAHELHRRELFIKRGHVRHVAQQRLRLERRGGHVVPADGHAPAHRPHQAGEQLDRRRFACAIRAEEGKQLALRNGQRQAVQRLQVAVVHGEVFDFDHEGGLVARRVGCDAPARPRRQEVEVCPLPRRSRPGMKLLAFLFLLPLAVFAADRQPNIIFIMADDLGWTDLASFGSQYYETPNIDRLASQGMKLTRHHHCQNCQPTRAALMTGQYAARTGVYTVGGIDRFDWSTRPLRPVDNVTELPLDRVILPQVLKKAGYATAMFGKWHLGEKGPHHPGQRGFDEAIVSMGKHFGFATNPKVDVPEGEYLADFLTNKAVDFITRHKDAPFFLYLPHFGVHSPYQAKKELIAKFEGKAAVGGHGNPAYAAMIASVDESVGRVIQTLDELKLAEDTVLIFTSDNGGVGGYTREGLKKSGDTTDNAPLRSGKGSLYEGGTRVPFIVRWPGVTKAGTSCDVPTIHVDVLPTLAEIGKAALPEGQPHDGESLVPLFRDPAAALKRKAIYQHFPGYLGAGENTWRTTPVSLVEVGDWKLMEYLEDGRLELYNLKDDIGESKNLATEMPDKAKELHAKLQTWREAIKAPMPLKNTPSAETPKKKGKGKGKGKKKADA